jgi:hypothetical protein
MIHDQGRIDAAASGLPSPRHKTEKTNKQSRSINRKRITYISFFFQRPRKKGGKKLTLYCMYGSLVLVGVGYLSAAELSKVLYFQPC